MTILIINLNIDKMTDNDNTHNVNKGSNTVLSAVVVIKAHTLNWMDEINKCVTISSKNNIYITSLLKEILLRNNIPLTYSNIEKLKYELIVFVKKAKQGEIGLSRTSEIFLTKEDKKFLPIYKDSFVSHLFIDNDIWEQYGSNGF